MRGFTPDMYRRLLEFTSDETLKEHMNSELEIIASIEKSQTKTFIDLGAGYGRITRYLSKIAKEVISIEINPSMLIELREISKTLANGKVIEGDITNLSNIFQKSAIQNPVFLLLQNTLGTIEGEKPEELILGIKKLYKQNSGEIILSLFRQEALYDWGQIFYQGIQEMVGEIDFEKTDYSNGLFASKTGYTSKWRNKQEIQTIVETLEAHVISEVWHDRYCVLHLI